MTQPRPTAPNEAAERLLAIISVSTDRNTAYVTMRDLLDAALGTERLRVVEQIRSDLPEDWHEQLTIINKAARAVANAEQITLLDLSNKALRVLAALDAVAGLSGEEPIPPMKKATARPSMTEPTPQTDENVSPRTVPIHLLEVVGKALYGWGNDEPNEATGYTTVYESTLVAAAVHEAGYRREASSPALDVEVLARALIESDLMPRYLEYARLSPSMNPSETVEHLAATWASFVAREYARLKSTGPGFYDDPNAEGNDR